MEPTTADCYLRQISYWTREILGSMISRFDFSAPIVQRFNLLFLALDSPGRGGFITCASPLHEELSKENAAPQLANGRFRWDGQMVRTSTRSHFLEMNIQIDQWY